MAKQLKYTNTRPKYMEGLTKLQNASSVQYQWLYEHGCPHRHRFTRHFSCYLKQYDIQERKGCVDIEAGALDADFDICLSWAIKTVGVDEVFYDNITKEDLDVQALEKKVGEALAALGLKDATIEISVVPSIERTGGASKLKRFVPLGSVS